MRVSRVTAVLAAVAAILICHLSCGGGSVEPPAEPGPKTENPNPPTVAVVDINGWSRAGDPAMYHGDELYELINGGAELYHRLGFETAVTADYVDPEGRTITLEVFEMSDVAGASELFDEKTGGVGEPVAIGDEGAAESYYLNVRVGRRLVTITGFDNDEATTAGIRALAEGEVRALEGMP